ncbi:hypothetical protein G4D82_10505 [Flavobacterium sp. CYK-4]|uniref:hypothetical protein n=1 Tax=Flavobacterium lotistagni TaxID=2709660 RepID=UPI001409D7CA|nr:hypothetical protein [Flavobacterium lotistagni]NHM07654.1 hypothetical protein [Flavobacterium lotistagni]
MRFNIVINQDRCIKFKLNVSQAALMSVLTEVSSWASEKAINGKTYWWVSRNKVIEQLPLFYEKPDTVYRHFKYLAAIGLVEYENEKRRDYLRLTEKGKRWNKLGNESEFAINSEMNPSKLGNESELVKQVIVSDFELVKPAFSEMNPTNNIDNIINDKSVETALEFLQLNFSSRYETWMMQNKSKIKDFDRFVIDFNCKVIEEKKPFEADILFARLNRLSSNWQRFDESAKSKGLTEKNKSGDSPAYMNKKVS